ncbi:MAG: hypothetical protein KAS67_03220 [Thermoplasmata archaeon]|nr:hypothetical protein [Thermoplasmata archaeon]
MTPTMGAVVQITKTLITRRILLSDVKGGIKIQLTETYIAPWALRGEEIPLHLKWEKNTEYDIIRVTVPDGFVVKDMMNVKNCTACNQIIEIDELADDGYFGLAISNDDIFDSETIEEDVIIDFLSKSKIIHQERLSARLFRPFVTVQAYPKEMLLDDQIEASKSPSIKIQLSYVGFGDVFLDMRVKIGGKWSHTGEKFYYELLNLLFEEDLDEKTTENGEKLVNKLEESDGISRFVDSDGFEVQFEKEELIEEIKRFSERLVIRKELPSDLLENEDAEELRSWLEEKVKTPNFTEMLYSKFDQIILDVLINALKRNPSENVYLRDADTSALIKQTTDHIDIEICYNDALGNKYETLMIPIKVIDKRSKENKIFIPIEVEIKSKVIDIIRGEMID